MRERDKKRAAELSTKEHLHAIYLQLDDLSGRARVLEQHAERQAAVIALLLKNTERLVREKEVLLMHLGLTYLEGQTLGAIPPKLDQRWHDQAASLAARIKGMKPPEPH